MSLGQLYSLYFPLGVLFKILFMHEVNAQIWSDHLIGVLSNLSKYDWAESDIKNL